MSTAEPLEALLPAPSPSNNELGRLLARIALQDQSAFEQLIDQTGKRIFALISAVMLATDLSEDIYQEVYLQVWRTAGRYDPSCGSAIAWLVTVARRRAIDKVRHEQSFKVHQLRYAALSPGIAYDEVTEAVHSSFEAAAVTDSLPTLSAKQHQAISLAFYTGMTYQEVAKTLNVPLPTVKSRIRDGTIRLGLALTEEPDIVV